jgi:hypothetical protein
MMLNALRAELQSVDAGSAAQHRAYKMAPPDLLLSLTILESVIHQTLLAEGKVAGLRSRTPPRTPQKIKKNGNNGMGQTGR